MGNPILRMRIAHYCAAFKAFSDSLIPSFFMSDVSESLRSLNKNELIIHSFFAKNERFAQKTDERIPNPALLACGWVAILLL